MSEDKGINEIVQKISEALSSKPVPNIIRIGGLEMSSNDLRSTELSGLAINVLKDPVVQKFLIEDKKQRMAGVF